MLRGILASVAFGVAASGLAQPSLVEYPAETSTFFPPTPTGIASGPSGLVWFVNFNAAHSIGTVTLDGDTTGIAQPPGDVATGAITGAPATYLWAGGSKNILKITRDPTPTFGVTFALSPVPDASLFHSIDSIAWDGASTVWFTDFVGGARKLGRLDTTSGSVQESALSNDCMFPAGFGRDMVRASDGNVWFTSSSGACKILADGSVLLQPLTSPAGGITSGPDGRIWVAEYTGTAHLEAFDPHDCPGAACQIATYDLPSPVHDLHGLAAGPDDRIWFVSHGAPDVAGSVKTDGSDFQFVALPSGSKPEKITAGPVGDNSVWFTESGTLKIGRITGLAASPVLYLQNGRFKVEVSWSVPDQNRSGQGIPVSLTGDTGYFWFFSDNNIELVLKVLDATGVNGHFWVFYGALSDVAYTITVTDTATGARKVYDNPYHRLASFADTSAFAAGVGTPGLASRAVERDVDEMAADELYALYGRLDARPARRTRPRPRRARLAARRSA